MENLCPGLVLVLVLCVAGSVQAQPADVKHRYEHFLEQHVDANMNEQKCGYAMEIRKLKEPDGKTCKKVNTFIQADKGRIRNICVSGINEGNLVRSGQPFPLIRCEYHRGRPTYPHCQYKGTNLKARYVKIACDQGWPVHYGDDIIVV